MRDEQLDSILRGLDRRFEPEPAFADSLYATLAAEAGLGPRGVGVRRIFPAALGRSMRLAWALLLVALLAVLLVGLLVYGSQTRSPEAIVERSQAAYLAPPPFAMTTRFPDGSEALYRFDGSTLRLDVTKGRFFGELPEGYYILRNDEQQAGYNPESNEWATSENPMGSASTQIEPNWLAPVLWEPGQPPPLVACEAWEAGDEAKIAGRSADEVRCGSDRYWIDRDSGLLVKRVGGPDPRVPEVEVVALDLAPTFEPSLFAFEPPPGALTGAEPPPARPQSDLLQPGEPAPTWTGRLLDGTAFSTDELTGRPAAIFIWCHCYIGPAVQHFVAEARSRADEMHLVLVGSNEGMVRGLVDWLEVETPVVADYQGDLLRAWGINDLSALVLLRADGTVADIHPARFDEAKLAAILDALASGENIPEPDPVPEPVFEEDGSIPLTTVLEVGQPAPELRGPRLGGGELSTLHLVGTPTVVAYFEPPDPVTGPQTDAAPPDRLIAEIQARGGELNLLLVTRGEPSPGAAATYLDEQSADVPLVFDWDGTLGQRWGLIFWPSLVLLDADGRVAGIYGPQSLEDPSPIIDAFANGEPLPSAAPIGQ
jgi:hypothetical protein